jgi:hypothetical protein
MSLLVSQDGKNRKSKKETWEYVRQTNAKPESYTEKRRNDAYLKSKEKQI